MKRWLEWEIEYKQLEGRVKVWLWEKTAAAGQERWPKTKIVGSASVSVSNIWGKRSHHDIMVEVAKDKDRLFRRYKKSLSYNDTLNKLCEEWSVARHVIEDTQTTEMIKAFGGEKKT